MTKFVFYLCFNKLKQILKMRSYSCILKVIVVYALLGIVIASCIDKTIQTILVRMTPKLLMTLITVQLNRYS